MLIIKRASDGTHTMDGNLFQPHSRRYWKKTLTRAVQMWEPFRVETLEGTMEGKAGDLLMIGAHGEMYPCDKDIFAETYELAE